MGSRTDDKFTALRAQGFTGAMPDMVLQWLQANGATSDSISDAWVEMMAVEGFTGQHNDAWYEMLGSLGFGDIDHIADRDAAFWAAGGNIGTERQWTIGQDGTVYGYISGGIGGMAPRGDIAEITVDSATNIVTGRSDAPVEYASIYVSAHGLYVLLEAVTGDIFRATDAAFTAATVAANGDTVDVGIAGNAMPTPDYSKVYGATVSSQGIIYETGAPRNYVAPFEVTFYLYLFPDITTNRRGLVGAVDSQWWTEPQYANWMLKWEGTRLEFSASKQGDTTHQSVLHENPPKGQWLSVIAGWDGTDQYLTVNTTTVSEPLSYAPESTTGRYRVYGGDDSHAGTQISDVKIRENIGVAQFDMEMPCAEGSGSISYDYGPNRFHGVISEEAIHQVRRGPALEIPDIYVQPSNMIIATPGDGGTMTVAARNSQAELNYQWEALVDGNWVNAALAFTNAGPANLTSFVLGSTTPADYRRLRCVVTTDTTGTTSTSGVADVMPAVADSCYESVNSKYVKVITGAPRNYAFPVKTTLKMYIGASATTRRGVLGSTLVYNGTGANGLNWRLLVIENGGAIAFVCATTATATVSLETPAIYGEWLDVELGWDGAQYTLKVNAAVVNKTDPYAPPADHGEYQICGGNTASEAATGIQVHSILIEERIGEPDPFTLRFDCTEGSGLVAYDRGPGHHNGVIGDSGMHTERLGDLPPPIDLTNCYEANGVGYVTIDTGAPRNTPQPFSCSAKIYQQAEAALERGVVINGTDLAPREVSPWSNEGVATTPQIPVGDFPYAPSRVYMKINNPRPMAELGTKSRYRWNHSVMPYEVPICMLGGAPPFKFTHTGIGYLVQRSPAFNPNMVSWAEVHVPANTAGDYTVTAIDTEGTEVSVTITVVVDDTHFAFVAPGGNGNGTIGSPFGSTQDVYGVDGLALSAYREKTIVLREGDHPAPVDDYPDPSQQIPLDMGKPTQWMGYPGETATMVQLPQPDGLNARGFNNNVSGRTTGQPRAITDMYWANLNITGGASFCRWLYDINKRHVWWQLLFRDVEAWDWGVTNTGGIIYLNGNHQHISVNDVEFRNYIRTNTNNVAGLEFYTTAYLNIDGIKYDDFHISHGTFIKATCEEVTVTSEEAWLTNTTSRGWAYQMNGWHRSSGFKPPLIPEYAQDKGTVQVRYGLYYANIEHTDGLVLQDSRDTVAMGYGYMDRCTIQAVAGMQIGTGGYGGYIADTIVSNDSDRGIGHIHEDYTKTNVMQSGRQEAFDTIYDEEGRLYDDNLRYKMGHQAAPWDGVATRYKATAEGAAPTDDAGLFGVPTPTNCRVTDNQSREQLVEWDIADNQEATIIEVEQFYSGSWTRVFEGGITDRAYRATSLQPGQEYKYRVRTIQPVVITNDVNWRLEINEQGFLQHELTALVRDQEEQDVITTVRAASQTKLPVGIWTDVAWGWDGVDMWIDDGSGVATAEAEYSPQSSLGHYRMLGSAGSIATGYQLAEVMIIENNDTFEMGFYCAEGSGLVAEDAGKNQHNGVITDASIHAKRDDNSVLVPPTISTQPATQTVTEPGGATFSVVASHADPLFYQWQAKDDAGVWRQADLVLSDVGSVFTDTLTVNSTIQTDNRIVSVAVGTDAAGKNPWVRSHEAALVVNAPSGTGFSDDFNRPNQNLEDSTDWIRGLGNRPLEIVDNAVTLEGSGDSHGIYHHPVAFAGDTFSQITVVSVESANTTDVVGVACCVREDGLSMYVLEYTGSSTSSSRMVLSKYINGTLSEIGRSSHADGVGHVLRLEATNSEIIGYYNGIETFREPDTSIPRSGLCGIKLGYTFNRKFLSIGDDFSCGPIS